MKPMEAWGIISEELAQLHRFRASYCGKGFSQEQIEAEVIAFEALRRMEEDGKAVG